MLTCAPAPGGLAIRSATDPATRSKVQGLIPPI
jgi:hypothetical protein